jgi:hypothetical protein
MNESRCDERLKARVEESTCLTASHTLAVTNINFFLSPRFVEGIATDTGGKGIVIQRWRHDKRIICSREKYFPHRKYCTDMPDNHAAETMGFKSALALTLAAGCSMVVLFHICFIPFLFLQNLRILRFFA